MKHAYKWLPEINTDRCTGCGACIKACIPGSLEMIEGVAELVNAGTCGSEEHCIGPCPEKAIRMKWIPLEGDRSMGRWR